VYQRREDARARRAQGVAQRDRAAVDVDPRGIELELADASDGLRREGLVQLDQVDLVDRQPGALEDFLGRGDRPEPYVV